MTTQESAYFISIFISLNILIMYITSKRTKGAKSVKAPL